MHPSFVGLFTGGGTPEGLPEKTEGAPGKFMKKV